MSSILTHSHAKANNSYTALKETELLQKYIELSGQTDPGRIQLMQTLSPLERSYLWRVHLGLYLARNSTLSKDQQSLVVEALELVGPKLFNPPDPKDPGGRITLERVEQLRQRGLQLFSRSEAAEIFSAVGGAQDGEALRKYNELSTLSKGDRKVSFSLMSAENKASLWRIHFGLNLARHPEWTEHQRSIVLEALTMVTPQLYKTPKDDNWTSLVDQPVRLLIQKALIVFTQEEGAALFAELGFTEQSKLSHAPTTRGCACAQDSDWCNYQCISSGCTVLTWGCGTFGIYACNGRCHVPPPQD
ncbi:MAG TPA: bacteriocin fulvocin C-related protein [Pyrinomonadaceae bacterium]|nr:bacteriocin fulvocin C-related protein [Pyrinomonadaceae bacterium]